MAGQLFGCFPPPEVGDPEIMLSGAVKMFLSYPEAAVRSVCDPVRGLPATSKWAPRLSEIRDALEVAMGPIRFAENRERLDREAREQIAARKPLEITDGRPKPTYEELKARCAASGLHLGPKGMERVDGETVRKKYAVTPEDWAKIPDAKGAA